MTAAGLLEAYTFQEDETRIPESEDDGRTRWTTTTSPGADRRLAERDRLCPARQPGVAHHRLRQSRLPLSGRPASAARALSHLDPDGGRQDRDPQDQRRPAGPLPDMVRQRPATPPARHRPRNPVPPSVRAARRNQ